MKLDLLGMLLGNACLFTGSPALVSDWLFGIFSWYWASSGLIRSHFKRIIRELENICEKKPFYFTFRLLSSIQIIVQYIENNH